jgi:hypothetical protein
MQNDSEILESLKCPVCLEYAEEPMECQFCNHIFCKKCIASEQSKIKITSCPMCRKESNYKESAFAKRLLGNLPVSCPNECGANISRNELKGHLTKCPNKNYLCNVQGCRYEGKKSDFIQHLTSQHENEILNKFDKNLSQNTQKLYVNTPGIQGGQIPSEKEINVNLPLFENGPSDINFNNNFLNSKGDPVSLGQSGIFYCSKRLGFNCGCCDGNCGPDNGCCCKACMDLNIQIRNLPKGQMVNKEGRVAKWTRCSYFCGVEYERETKNIFKKIFKKKIICEYPNEPCHDCQVLNKNIKFYLSIHEINNL